MPTVSGETWLYLIGFFLLYLCCRLFLKPLRWLVELVGSCLLGGLGILLWNLVGTPMGIGVNLNFLSSVFAGVLGIPGMILAGFLSRIL